MIRLLCTGTLYGDPQARTSQNGSTFAIAKVKADDKNGAWIWVSIIAFGNEAERLLQLKAGNALAASGRAEVSVWTDKEGNSHPSLSLVVEELAALKGKPKPRQERPHRATSGNDAPFDDPLPFG
mgnify:CR=1 FL=1